MKRLLLAILILAAGTSVVLALRSATNRLNSEMAATTAAVMTQTQILAQTRIQLTSAEELVRDLKHTLQAMPPGAAHPPFSALALLAGAAHLSAEQSERLLAELGFNWNTTGDYLIVSKETLHDIGLDGMKGFKLRDAACQVLAITPEERAGIEAMTQKLGEDYRTWAEAHFQRTEPHDDVVAQYALAADPEFSQNLSNSFTSGVLATLGNERSKLFLQYASSWMADLGMDGGGERSLTVKRYQAGEEPRLNFESSNSGNTMSTDVSPYQPLPAAFLPLFPNGWPDLAQREGFELPKEFRKK